MIARWPPGLRVWVVAALLGCSTGDPEPPTEPNPAPTADPGFLQVTLATPNATDGAVLFTLGGGALDSLDGLAFELFFATTGVASAEVLVAGDVVAGAVARFWVPDRNNLSQYTATLREAAARGTYQQQTLTSYSLTISR